MMTEKRIMIGIIIVASCVLVLLYSPWGSPDNYIENDSCGFRTGVDFSSRIENAPREVVGNFSYSGSSVPYSGSGYAELRSDLHSSVDVSVPETHLEANYKVNSKVNNNRIAVASSSSGYAPTTTYTVIKTQSENKNNSNNISIAALGSVSFGSLSNVKNQSNVFNLSNISNIISESKNTEIIENKKQGFASLATDLSMQDENLLANGPMRLDGGTNPGDPGDTSVGTPGDEPTGDPIPVGDGFWFLMILTFGFAIWKFKLQYKLMKH